jgi:hypothetical protein
MFTKPSPGELIETVIVALNKDILPELQSERAQVACVMAQAVLQTVCQAIPVFQQIMTQEHNEMTTAFRDVASTIGSSAGPDADRIRERARSLGSREDIPVPMAYQDLAAVYQQLSLALVETLNDLDILIREGNTTAEDAVLRIREHLGPRTVREVGTYVAGAGMVGRG